MASKVICIDLWFNDCAEQQGKSSTALDADSGLTDPAFCRVFRIGQKSETFITRFIVEGSADTKLRDMQMRKHALISRAMDDRSVMKRLTLEEVMRLFGEVRLDRNKRPFIHLEDDEKLDRIFEGNGRRWRRLSCGWKGEIGYLRVHCVLLVGFEVCLAYLDTSIYGIMMIWHTW